MKNCIINHFRSRLYLIPFAILFIVLLILFHYIYLYHDDFAYASLGYARENFTPEKSSGNILYDVLSAMHFHYINWGGRVVFFFFLSFLFQMNLTVIQIFCPLVITLIMYSIYRFSKMESGNFHALIIPLFACILYLSIGQGTLKDSIHWITAFSEYLLPFLFFFIAVIIHQSAKYESGIATGRKTWHFPVMIICFALSAVSHEQISIVTVAYCAICLFTTILRGSKEERTWDIAFLLISVGGLVFLLAAPGNFVRMQYEMQVHNTQNIPLIKKAAIQTMRIVVKNISPRLYVFLIPFILMQVYASFRLLKEKAGIKALNIAGIIYYFITLILLCPLYLLIIKNDSSFNIGNPLHVSIVTAFLVFFILSLYTTVFFLVRKGKQASAILYICALLSQAAMIASPIMAARNQVIFLFLLFPVLCVFLSDITLSSPNFRTAAIIAVIVMGVYSSINMFDITSGYHRNGAANRYNDHVMRQSANDLKTGKKINRIVLRKIPDLKYAEKMPYEEPRFDYINTMMKSYYHIPLNVKLIWVDRTQIAN